MSVCISSDEFALLSSPIYISCVLLNTTCAILSVFLTFFAIFKLLKQSIIQSSTRYLLIISLFFNLSHQIGYLCVKFITIYQIFFKLDKPCEIYTKFTECVIYSRGLLFGISGLTTIQTSMTLDRILSLIFSKLYRKYQLPSAILFSLIASFQAYFLFDILTAGDKFEDYVFNCAYYPPKSVQNFKIFLSVIFYISLYNIQEKFESREEMKCAQSVVLISTIQFTTQIVFSFTSTAFSAGFMTSLNVAIISVLTYSSTRYLLIISLFFNLSHQIGYLSIKLITIYQIFFKLDEPCEIYTKFTDCLIYSRSKMFGIAGLALIQTSMTIDRCLSLIFSKIYRKYQEISAIILSIIAVLMSHFLYDILTINDNFQDYVFNCSYFPTKSNQNFEIFLSVIFYMSIAHIIVDFSIMGFSIRKEKNKRGNYNMKEKFESREEMKCAQSVFLISTIQFITQIIFSLTTSAFPAGFMTSLNVAIISVMTYSVPWFCLAHPILIILMIHRIRVQRIQSIHKMRNHRESQKDHMILQNEKKKRGSYSLTEKYRAKEELKCTQQVVIISTIQFITQMLYSLKSATMLTTGYLSSLSSAILSSLTYITYLYLKSITIYQIHFKLDKPCELYTATIDCVLIGRGLLIGITGLTLIQSSMSVDRVLTLIFPKSYSKQKSIKTSIFLSTICIIYSYFNVDILTFNDPFDDFVPNCAYYPPKSLDNFKIFLTITFYLSIFHIFLDFIILRFVVLNEKRKRFLYSMIKKYRAQEELKCTQSVVFISTIQFITQIVFSFTSSDTVRIGGFLSSSSNAIMKILTYSVLWFCFAHPLFIIFMLKRIRSTRCKKIESLRKQTETQEEYMMKLRIMWS
ncbi:unnamed protein product [Caenorhabditis angaria]|uniref:Uncharacterized protein n=1 Tax=Caenorhabditis angaria TaxID=860376 RepID=A0A9P1IE17_9PELO|nr:unnamed protein product [Caenorhabditis angaria]